MDKRAEILHGGSSDYPRESGVHELFLDIAGRLPDHPAIRTEGYRIELGEVEAALRRCSGVENAAAVVWTFKSGFPGLVGCVVLKPGIGFDSSLPTVPGESWIERETLAELARLLPEPMKPDN